MYLRSSVFKIAVLLSACTAFLHPWWNSDYTRRIPLVMSETNGYGRTNALILVDLTPFAATMGLRDISGADIRIVNADDATLLPSRVIRRASGQAAAVVFQNTVTAATNAFTNFLYYNFSESASSLMPTVPYSAKMRVRRNYERYYEPGLEPSLYFIRIGIVGTLGDASYIKSIHNLNYSIIYSVPIDTTDYDLLINNLNNVKTNVTNYYHYINNGGGVLDCDLSGYYGASLDRWLVCNLPFFDYYQDNYPASTPGSVSGNAYFICTITNFSHFITLGLSPVPDYPVVISSATAGFMQRSGSSERMLPMTILDRDNVNSGNALHVRDYLTSPYNSNGLAMYRGRFGFVPIISKSQYLTPVGKWVMQRLFIYLAGYDDNGIGYPLVITNLDPEVQSFVKTIRLTTTSPSFVSGELSGQIVYYSNMNAARTPVMVFSNMNTATTYAVSMGSGSSWTAANTYAFSGTYATTPVPGKYAIIIRTNDMEASPSAYPSNDYIMMNIHYDSSTWTDYRCIPQIISRNGNGTGNLGATYVLVSSPVATKITAVVYNKKGIPVRTLVKDEALNLSRNIIWDGKNDGGVAAIAGNYVIKLDIKDRGTYYARVRVVD